MEKIKPSSYYEGVLQLRNPSQEIIDFVIKSVNERKDCRIAREETLASGIDFYFTSQHYLRALAKKLKEKFAGHLDITATLHTRSRTGEDLYRVTVLFQMYSLKKGEVITIGEEDYRIELFGKDILLKEVKSGKKIHKDFKEIERFLGK